MPTLLAFALGYLIGARGGDKGFDDVVDALKAIRESDEMADLLVALRSHASYTLRELAGRLEPGSGADADGFAPPTDLVERVRRMSSSAD